MGRAGAGFRRRRVTAGHTQSGTRATRTYLRATWEIMRYTEDYPTPIYRGGYTTPLCPPRGIGSATMIIFFSRDYNDAAGGRRTTTSVRDSIADDAPPATVTPTVRSEPRGKLNPRRRIRDDPRCESR